MKGDRIMFTIIGQATLLALFLRMSIIKGRQERTIKEEMKNYGLES